jgi:TPP-dependent pyruvate/acetoin dehydrogenase alpha subunit
LEHCGPFKDDNLNYRPKKELNFWLKQCPLTKYQNNLLKLGLLDNKTIKNYNLKIDKEINLAFKKARQDKFPNKKNLFTNIYA